MVDSNTQTIEFGSPVSVLLAGDSIWSESTPASVSVNALTVKTYVDDRDGDTWMSVTAHHDGPWDIYTDSAFGPAVKGLLEANGYSIAYCDFSEQVMQDNGAAHMDVDIAYYDPIVA